MIHATYGTRILVGLLLVSSLGSTSIRATATSSKTSTSWGIPLLTGLAAGALVNYCMSKRTVEAEREKAVALIYAYHNHYYSPERNEFNHANWVLRATDEALENRLYWDNVWATLFGGSLVGGMMYGIMNGGNEGTSHSCFPALCFNVGSSSQVVPFR